MNPVLATPVGRHDYTCILLQCLACGCTVLLLDSHAHGVLPQVIKRTGVQMQQRQVPAASVTSWQHRIEKLEPQVGGQVGRQKGGQDGCSYVQACDWA